MQRLLDWEVKDCNDYFINMVKEKNLTIQNYEQFLSLLHKGFSKLKPLKGWGNARDVVKLFESTLETRAMRVHQERSKIEETTYDTERIITENDIRAAVQCMVDSRMGSSSSASKREDTSEMDPFAELDRLYRMEMVKAKLQQLKNTYVVAERDGEDPPPLGHFIFTGSPGTGKTTGKIHLTPFLSIFVLIVLNFSDHKTQLLESCQTYCLILILRVEIVSKKQQGLKCKDSTWDKHK